MNEKSGAIAESPFWMNKKEELNNDKITLSRSEETGVPGESNPGPFAERQQR